MLLHKTEVKWPKTSKISIRSPNFLRLSPDLWPNQACLSLTDDKTEVRGFVNVRAQIRGRGSCPGLSSTRPASSVVTLQRLKCLYFTTETPFPTLSFKAALSLSLQRAQTWDTRADCKWSQSELQSNKEKNVIGVQRRWQKIILAFRVCQMLFFFSPMSG